MEAPCHYCDERYVTCHDSCDKYKKFKAHMIMVNEARKVFSYGRSVIIESSLRQSVKK